LNTEQVKELLLRAVEDELRAIESGERDRAAALCTNARAPSAQEAFLEQAVRRMGDDADAPVDSAGLPVTILVLVTRDEGDAPPSLDALETN
jgi:hypothetical protein